MAWFSKKPQSPSLVPASLLGQLHAFGQACWQAKLNGHPVRDPRYSWDNFFSQFLSAYNTNLTQAIAEIHKAAGSDVFARYGGYQVVAEFDAACKDPLYLSMIDAALELMYTRGLSSGYMTGYERDRWVETHGDLRTSFDRIVEVAQPSVDAVPNLVIEPGQNVMVAKMGPSELDNQFWIERLDGSTYVAFSMRQWDNDAVTLTRCEEKQVNTSDSLGGILRNVGDFLRTPTYWAHPDLAPYFPERRSF